MKTKQEIQHTPTPKYGYEETAWDVMIDIGLNYAIRTLDPLTKEINEGSSTLTYCSTSQQAAFIVRAVNSHEELLEAARTALNTLKGINGHYIAEEKLEKAIAQAEGK